MFPKTTLSGNIINVSGVKYPAYAYITYLQERGKFADFRKAGYRIFSAPVFFGSRGVNATSGIAPFERGIYDFEDGTPDYSPLHQTLDHILNAVPDALIFLRLNVVLPVWWEKKHPEECNRIDEPYRRSGINYLGALPGGTLRESFYSSLWLETVKSCTREFVRYLRDSKYAPHIIGLQISDGNTEEWFHFDLNAGISPRAEAPFLEWMKENYPMEADGAHLPLGDIYQGETAPALSDRNKVRFLEFANQTVTKAIKALAHIVKEESEGKILCGTFYGYSWEVGDTRWGSAALGELLDCTDIDFFSSPCSYSTGRDPAHDWPDMQSVSSIMLHGKTVFTECDIRTDLTRPLAECRKDSDPYNIYHGHVWNGPENREDTVNLLRTVFARRLCAGHALWWFDMWGGWYDAPEMMEELARQPEIMNRAAAADDAVEFPTEAAVFGSERSLYAANAADPFNGCANIVRHALHSCGTSCELYDIADFSDVIGRYKAVVLSVSVATPELLEAIDYLEKHDIPYIRCRCYGLDDDSRTCTTDAENLRRFFTENGLHIYSDTEDSLYIGHGYLAVHSCTDTPHDVNITLPKKCRIYNVITNELVAESADRITLTPGRYECILLALQKDGR